MTLGLTQDLLRQPETKSSFRARFLIGRGYQDNVLPKPTVGSLVLEKFSRASLPNRFDSTEARAAWFLSKTTGFYTRLTTVADNLPKEKNITQNLNLN